MLIQNPLIAEGAGLAALNPDQFVVGLPRSGDMESLTTAITSTYFNLKDTGLGDPRPFAHPSARLPLSFFSYIENTVAERGRVLNARATLQLDESSQLRLRMVLADGSEAPTVHVGGVPVVAMRAPIQCTSTDWASRTDLSPSECLPEAIRELVLGVIERGIKVTALPLFLEGRIYCGYALTFLKPGKSGPNDPTNYHRIDVTAGAAFVFPYQLTHSKWKPEDVRYQVKQRLESDEPPDIVDDFESRYLASAYVASYYRAARKGWGLDAAPTAPPAAAPAAPPAAVPVKATLSALTTSVERSFQTSSTKLNGVEVSSKTTTRFTLGLPRAAPFTASFRGEGVMEKLTKIFKKELQTGDAEFDKQVYVTTDTPDATRSFLANENARLLISGFVRAGGVEIEGQTLTLWVDGEEQGERREVLEFLELLAK
jgi:hypothetical protein